MPRRREPTDSLDLLLDTICNTFGGILFIALLVVILLQLQGEQTAATTEKDVTAADLAALRIELADRIDSERRLRELLDRQRHTLADLAPDELADLIAEHHAVNATHAERQTQREDLLQQSAELAESIEQTHEDLKSTAADLEAAKARVRTLEQQVADQRESRRRELRTPVQHMPHGKREIGCVLQYGRFYIWHRYDGFGQLGGLNTDEFIVLEDGIATVRTTPRPTKGIPIDDSATCREKLSSRLARFAPDDCYIAVVTRPDSFAEWQVLRNHLAEQGFEYRLMPFNDGETITDRGGSGSRVQ